MNNNLTKEIKITNSIKYIGVNDKTIDIFEGQYPVPNGVSYNSYVILDDKVTVLDTVDARATDEWLKNIKKTLGGCSIDYLVVSHMEPDHAANVGRLINMYPHMKVVATAKTFSMIPQFFDVELLEGRKVVVGEGDELNIGKHTLQFFMAPMVHWPEVMVTYEQTEKILFSADGFGKFGSLDVNEPWDDEARRYFINIVGKYGVQVQALLKKAATLEISMICPLHGPILKDDLGHYIDKYVAWSSYTPEEEGILIAYGSVYGNTAKAAKKLASILEEKGCKNVILRDLTRDDISEVVGNAYKVSKLVIASISYDNGIFPCVETFLRRLKAKKYQNRTVGIIENGSWAPCAGKHIKGLLEEFKNITICDPVVTIKSALKDENINALTELADNLMK